MKPTEERAKQINSIIAIHAEWLFKYENKTQSLTRNEIDVRFEFGKLVLSVSLNEGFKFWRVKDWKQEDEKIIFEVAKQFGKDNQQSN